MFSSLWVTCPAALCWGEGWPPPRGRRPHARPPGRLLPEPLCPRTATPAGRWAPSLRVVTAGFPGPGAAGFVRTLQHRWRVWGLILNAIALRLRSRRSFSLAPGHGASFVWWGPTFSCQWLFSSWLWFWCSRRRWAHVPLGHYLILFQETVKRYKLSAIR